MVRELRGKLLQKEELFYRIFLVIDLLEQLSLLRIDLDQQFLPEHGRGNKGADKYH